MKQPTGFRIGKRFEIASGLRSFFRSGKIVPGAERAAAIDIGGWDRHPMKPMLLSLMMLIMITPGMARCAPLPDPLITGEREKVTSIAQWQEKRRPEILELFRENVYGRAPIERPDSLRFDIMQIDKAAMNGRATLKLINICFPGPRGEGKITLVLFIPNDAVKPAPGFILICHRHRNNIDPTREDQSPFWPAERIVARGYMAAAFHTSDVAPDMPGLFHESVHRIFGADDDDRASDTWGAIAAWGWGASRAMDYFMTDQDIDHQRIAVVGHSRGGKAALWCGAEDERFALVVGNNSGCTGAALARRKSGERVADINKRFPHWFSANYHQFNRRERRLPVDQHQLIALMAPRLVYVASASRDAWADPQGEFLACVHAAPVYQLFGLQGLETNELPKAGRPLHAGHIGYHLRKGRHNLTEYDWDRFMDFADRHWMPGQHTPRGDCPTAQHDPTDEDRR